MSLTKRKRRSDTGIKRGTAQERREASLRNEREYREYTLAALAAFTDERLRAFVLAINNGPPGLVDDGWAEPAPGPWTFRHIYALELVASEIARRGWDTPTLRPWGRVSAP